MGLIAAKVDTTQLQAALKKLAGKYTDMQAAKIATTAAWYLIQKSLKSPIPRDTGYLSRSRSLQWQGKTLRFGFNASYAAFQDAPNLEPGSVIQIRPKAKRCLYIPLTEAGRKHHRPGANPETEGLVRERDYILVGRAEIEVKGYGNRKGPNHYFSGTISKFWRQAIEKGVQVFRNELKALGGGSAPSNPEGGGA